MAKKVRIKDIAARLGLSSTLVSLVLNNKASLHGIKSETQERVISTAHSMGYFEASLADNKADSSSFNPGIIGMIVSSLKDPFVLELSEHLRKAFASIGYGFSILTLDLSDLRYGRFITSIRRIYSGIVLAGDTANDNIIRALKASYYPFVVLEKADVNLRLNSVKSDCEAGALKLVKHLQKFGYTRFAIIRSSYHSVYLEDKVKCMKDSIEENIPDSEVHECLLDIDITNSINDEQLIPYFRKPLSIDALITSEAALVYPVFESLHRTKVRIPGDVALVSMENGIGFDLLSTPVTRLRRDIPGMASKIVSMLWSEIKNSGRSKFMRSVNMPPDLIVGKSCGKL